MVPQISFLHKLCCFCSDLWDPQDCPAEASLHTTKTLPGPVPIMSVGRPVCGEINAFHVFFRVTCLALPQSPGSGLWNTSSIKPSAHTFCLRSISQRMEMSCSSPTCQICTKSLRGVKCGRSHLSDCASTVQDEARSTDEEATGQLVCSRVSSARCSCFVSQRCCYNLMLKIHICLHVWIDCK